MFGIVTQLCFLGFALGSSDTGSHDSLLDGKIIDWKFQILFKTIKDLEANDRTNKQEIHEMEIRMSALEAEFAKKEMQLESQIEDLKKQHQRDQLLPKNDVNKILDEHQMSASKSHWTENKTTSHENHTAARRQIANTQVAFYAVASPHYVTGIGAGRRVVFDSTITNIGNAYHNDTGTFIAPVVGTYVIFVTLSGKVDSGSTLYFQLEVNGGLRAKFISHTLQQSSQMVILSLRAGDSVYVKSAEDYNGILGTFYTTMSGFLVYEHVHHGVAMPILL